MSAKEYLNGYTKMAIISKNLSSNVYLYSKDGTNYAIKKLYLNPFAFEKSKNEIEKLKKISHPHIVQIFEEIETNYKAEDNLKCGFIITEYCESKLNRLVVGGPCPKIQKRK